MQDQDKTGWSRRQFWLTVLAVWVTFLVYSFIHAPIPGANEPHYLCKAKYYWQPEWCNRDLFLTSSNPHLMFYVVVGWLAEWCSLDVIAVITRGFGYLLLAIGWARFTRVLAVQPALSVVSVWLMLAMNSVISLSGEWLVGGIESKVFSYAFVLSGLADGLNRRWTLTGLQLGLAVAFHPLVGLWSVIAAGGATLWEEWRACRLLLSSFLPQPKTTLAPGHRGEGSGGEGRDQTALASSDAADTLRGESDSDAVAKQRPSPPAPLPGGPGRGGQDLKWKVSLVVGLVLFAFTSLTGIVPALSAVGGQSPQDSYTANYIQVFYRLAHHLDPMQFPRRGYVIYLLILAVSCWVAGRRIPQREYAWLRSFVIAAAGIAFVGWLAGWGPRPKPERMPLFELRMTILKFYPFRLADAVVPIFFVLAFASWFQDRVRWLRNPARTQRRLTAVAAVLMLGTLAYGFGIGSARYMPDDREGDWLDVCQWVKANTPPESLFITPRESWAFKWYAQRAEYVAFKDCPQDAKSLVTWNNRLRWLLAWAGTDPEHGRYTTEEVRKLHEHTEAEYFISRRLSVLDAPVVYENSTYTVYSMTSAFAAK